MCDSCIMILFFGVKSAYKSFCSALNSADYKVALTIMIVCMCSLVMAPSMSVFYTRSCTLQYSQGSWWRPGFGPDLARWEKIWKENLRANYWSVLLHLLILVILTTIYIIPCNSLKILSVVWARIRNSNYLCMYNSLILIYHS